MVNFLTLVGALGLFGGGIGYFAVPASISLSISYFLNLSESGLLFSLYMNPPFGMKSKFMLLAITNPREVLRGGRMRFKVHGPYNYDAYVRRDNIVLANSSERVNYHTHLELHLREELSADVDENIWMLNPIVPGTVKIIRKIVLDRVPFKRLSEPLVFNVINVMLDTYKERLIVRTTPRIALEGRKIELLELVTSMADRFGLSSLIPPGLPDNIFGFAHVQNTTVDVIEVYTGVGKTKDRFAEVSRWREKPQVEFWQGKCGKIAGTNGELYKPYVNTSKPIQIFFGLLCRTSHVVPLSKEPDVTEIGVPVWEYELSQNLYTGARTNPQNRCFCEDTRTYDCQFDGLLSMGPCFYDTPIYFARPNFKGADKRIVETTQFDESLGAGIGQRQSLFIERTTGAVLKLDLTLMAVFKMVRQRYVRDLAGVRNITYAPAFYTTQILELPLLYAWPIYAVPLMIDYYKPVMLASAGLGASVFAFKYVFGV